MANSSTLTVFSSYCQRLQLTCASVAVIALLALPAWAGSNTGTLSGAVSREAKGLHGLLLMTPDPDWQAKWDTPADTTPYIATTTEIYLGDTLSILGFVANPATDQQGEVNIFCAIQLVNATGKAVVAQPEVPCLEGKLSGPAKHSYLLPVGAQVLAELSDEPGRWTVHYQITDKHRAVTLKLQAHFDLIAKPNPATQPVQQ